MRVLMTTGVALLLGVAGANAADAPKVSIETLARTSTTITGEKIVVPPNPEVVAAIATFPPGAVLPIHKHPYPHYVYVLDGELTVYNVDIGRKFIARKGDFVVETNTNWHYGRNEGTVPVKLFAIDQLPAGVKSNMVVKP